MQKSEENVANNGLSMVLAKWEDVLHTIACLCLLVIAGLIIFDTLRRLSIGVPLQVQFELTELFLMPAVASLSLSRVFRDKAHLAIEIFTTKQFGRFWPYVNALILILSLLLFAGITWQSGLYTYHAFASEDIYIGIYDWHMWLAYVSGPLGSGTLCLRLLHDLIHDLVTGEIDRAEHMGQISE
jgi:TRAP-type C4-dicarboxylate transport system permease small subunit